MLKDGEKFRLYHGDCLEVMREFPNNSVDTIVTDPPFAFTGGISNGTSASTDAQFFEYWIAEVFKQFHRISKPESLWFLWTDWRTINVYQSALKKSAIDYHDQRWISQVLIHDREMVGMGKPFRNQTDWVALVRGKKTNFKERIPNNQPNVIREYWYYGKHEFHPAEKSVSFAEKLVKWSSDENQIVFDGFTGGGTVGVASVKNNRRFLGVELDESYFEIAKTRIESALNQQPLFETV